MLRFRNTRERRLAWLLLAIWLGLLAGGVTCIILLHHVHAAGSGGARPWAWPLVAGVIVGIAVFGLARLARWTTLFVHSLQGDDGDQDPQPKMTNAAATNYGGTVFVPPVSVPPLRARIDGFTPETRPAPETNDLPESHEDCLADPVDGSLGASGGERAASLESNVPSTQELLLRLAEALDRRDAVEGISPPRE